MAKRTYYVHKKMAHAWLRTFGFDNQPNAVAFRQRHRIGASVDCLITPPHLVRIIGKSRSGPQTISAKILYLRIRPLSLYSITDLHTYAACSAVPLIVVELRPVRHYCDDRTNFIRTTFPLLFIVSIVPQQ